MKIEDLEEEISNLLRKEIKIDEGEVTIRITKEGVHWTYKPEEEPKDNIVFSDMDALDIPDIDIESSEDFVLPESMEIPERDIQYQEDDGNSDCGDGGCII